MNPIRWLSSAALLAVLAASAHAQTILFADGFENGFAQWSPSGLWNLEVASDPCGAIAAPFPEGDAAAYYGIDDVCNYATGTSPNIGFLVMASSIVLPASGPAASFQCWTWHRTEPCNLPFPYDFFRVFVSTDGGAGYSVAASSCEQPLAGPQGVWSLRRVDLTPYLGLPVAVGFGFETVDGSLNDFTGVFVDRVEIRLEAGQPFCATTCPCAGPANIPELSYGGASGCTSSFAREGELSASGTPSVTSDDVVLTARELPPATVALFAQSSSTSDGAFFGDGRLCLAGSVLRLASRTASGGAVSFPLASDPPLSVAGQVPTAGGTRHYQVVYRDAAAYCTSSTFNTTNGFTIAWQP